VKIGYLMNTYPITSTTFIRREMESLEKMGLDIKKYAVRNWGEELVDPLDIADQARTHYLLSGNVIKLLISFFIVMFANPVGFLKGVGLWLQVFKNSGYLFVKHFAYLLQATYFYRISKQDQIEHVHVHFSTNATTVAMIAKVMGGVSYSFMAHGPDEFVDPTAASMHLKVQHAEFVAAISNYCRVQLVRFSSYEYWDKIIIVHCGLHVDEFEPDFNVAATNHSLICVGRLCPQKAQLLFPPALAEIRNKFPNLHLHLIGDGESRHALEESIKQHNVGDLITLHGWKANAEVREMVKQNRALLLPSFAEGLPVVIMEAFALGRPVISTFIAGIPELVDNKCGWIIPAGSIDHIAEAMSSALLATPEELAEKGREGRRRIEAEHNLEKIAPILYDAFEKYT
jgi:glycosyltransferase involved in cell wall biosynthesis